MSGIISVIYSSSTMMTEQHFSANSWVTRKERYRIMCPRETENPYTEKTHSWWGLANLKMNGQSVPGDVIRAKWVDLVTTESLTLMIRWSIYAAIKNQVCVFWLIAMVGTELMKFLPVLVNVFGIHSRTCHGVLISSSYYAILFDILHFLHFMHSRRLQKEW